MKRTTFFVSWVRCFVFLVGLLALLLAGTASAIELRDAEVTVGAVPVLQNAGGTVRLEQPQVNAVGHQTFFVPEPRALWQLGSGVVLLALLSTRRRRAASRFLLRSGADSAVHNCSSRLARRNAMESRSKCRGWSVQGAGLVFMLLALAAGPAVAQVPQDMAFSGRFVDGAGVPLVSPAYFQLWIYDAPAGGNPIYGEQHEEILLDPQGNFSVLFGSGATVFGSSLFDPEFFSGVERYVEVRLLYPPAILTPRVPIASVPWALVAERAERGGTVEPQCNAALRGLRRRHGGGPPDGAAVGEEDGDVGSWGELVRDRGLPGPPRCEQPLRVVEHGVTDPDGGAFTDFLARLNSVPRRCRATEAEEVLGDPAADPTVCLRTTATGACRSSASFARS